MEVPADSAPAPAPPRAAGLLGLGLAAALLLGAFAWLRPAFFRYLRLPESAYAEPVIAWQALGKPSLLALALVLGLLPLLRRRAGHASRAAPRCGCSSGARPWCWPGPSRART